MLNQECLSRDRKGASRLSPPAAVAASVYTQLLGTQLAYSSVSEIIANR
jgi:hypothetical protein